VACSCCGGNACDSFFGERSARRDVRAYLRHGLRGDAERLAEWAAATGLSEATVLDVGGGVGAIQAELVREGATAGTVVDVVPVYEIYARELADQTGITARTSFVLADLADEPGAVAPADVVALRRVVCCSPYGPRLLGVAAGLTRRILVASYPRRRPAVRLVAWLQNRIFALLRRDFRVYLHDPAELDAAATAQGLRRTSFHRGFVWESVAFERL
jgi:magnesium-protoporphyrin O-methyltransferase